MTSLADVNIKIGTGQSLSNFSRIIAVDGPAGGGKTTLAKRIFETCSIQKIEIVHMDDLYDGWENALSDHLTRTLLHQIVVPVSQGKSFGYRKYDWLQQRFGEIQQFDAPELLILEGVGSGQKVIRRYIDQLIWIDIDDETGLQRVLQRDGDYLETEMRIWQLKQSEHFRMDNTRDCATIRIDGKQFI